MPIFLRNSLLYVIVCIAAVLAHHSTWAHDYRAGAIKVDHPYALATKPGEQTGMVFFRAIVNQGKSADTLISVRTKRAANAYIFNPNGNVRADIAAGATLIWRHDKANVPHIMLEGLMRPLVKGEKFPLTLVFKKAGSVEVMVWVQEPKTPSAHQH